MVSSSSALRAEVNRLTEPFLEEGKPSAVGWPDELAGGVYIGVGDLEPECCCPTTCGATSRPKYVESALSRRLVLSLPRSIGSSVKGERSAKLEKK